MRKQLMKGNEALMKSAILSAQASLAKIPVASWPAAAPSTAIPSPRRAKLPR